MRLEEATCLSIRQPWADAILFLGKPVENRTWRTDFRKNLTIHTSATWDDYGEAWLKMKIRPTTRAIDAFLTKARGRLGRVVGFVDVVDCLRPDDYNETAHCECVWAVRPWCWVLRNPVALETTIPMKGQLGFFKAGIERI